MGWIVVRGNHRGTRKDAKTRRRKEDKKREIEFWAKSSLFCFASLRLRVFVSFVSSRLIQDRLPHSHLERGALNWFEPVSLKAIYSLVPGEWITPMPHA